MLQPVLALILWTLVVWVWLYATRVPAMIKADIDPQEALHAGALSKLPLHTRVVADNYNHLHEQPVIFYALCFVVHFGGATDAWMVYLAWGYVALRVVHSIVQNLIHKVTIRFAVFVLGSILLMIMAARAAFALF